MVLSVTTVTGLKPLDPVTITDRPVLSLPYAGTVQSGLSEGMGFMVTLMPDMYQPETGFPKK